MPNDNRNRRNQPPTGEGKNQKPVRGAARKLGKRSEVVQAQRGHPELNLGRGSRAGQRRRAQSASAESWSLKETVLEISSRTLQ
jgi:hypothetical protein